MFGDTGGPASIAGERGTASKACGSRVCPAPVTASALARNVSAQRLRAEVTIRAVTAQP